MGKAFIWHEANDGQGPALKRPREAKEVENYNLNSPNPKVTISTEITNKATSQITTSQSQLEQQDIPRNYMDELKQLIGDGLARVTVSADMGIKDFGTGASAMCSVSVTCDQSVAAVERAAQLAGSMARDIANEQRQRAENELQGILSERGQSR